MKFDRTLIDKDGAPTVKETQEYFKKNDYRMVLSRVEL